MFMSTHKQQLIQARHRASSGRRDDARPRVSDDALTPCPTRARRLFGALLRVVGSSAIVLVDASQVRAAAARRRAPAAHNTHILDSPALLSQVWIGWAAARHFGRRTFQRTPRRCACPCCRARTRTAQCHVACEQCGAEGPRRCGCVSEHASASERSQRGPRDGRVAASRVRDAQRFWGSRHVRTMRCA